MFQLYLCVTQDHRIPVIVLAAIVCAVSAVAGVFMLDRARRWRGFTALAWLTAGALVWAGGVWATHFIAMLGYDVGLPVSFDLGQTLLSAAIITVLGGAGFMLLHRARSMARAAAAGVVAAAGVSTMHFVGMYGLEVPADFFWDLRFAGAAVALGLTFGALATLSYARLEPTLARIGAASALSVLSVSSLHFVGMTALTLVPHGGASAEASGAGPQTMAVVIGLGALMLVVVSLAAGAIDAILSERKLAEEDRLRALVEQLRASEHEAQLANRAKSAFLSRMSHEFRTPLNGVIGVATMLRARVTPEQAELLDLVVDSGKALGGMVDDILALARLEDGELRLDVRPFEVRTLLEEVKARHRNRAETKGLAFIVDHAPSADRAFMGDPDRIAQILKCLVSNAIKFTPSGEVRVLAGATGDAQDAAREVIFAVEDTGAGVPEAAEALIFEHFGQVDSTITRKQDGAGLGLTLARMLCEQMGGRLELTRPPGGGSRFAAILPLADAPQEEAGDGAAMAAA